MAKIGNVPEIEMNARTERLQQSMRRWWPFYVMLAPGLLFYFVYHYLPIWEARLAFQDVRIIPPNIWVGAKHFVALASSPVFLQVLLNTIIISAMKLVFIFPVPILVALLLNECGQPTIGSLFSQSSTCRTTCLGWSLLGSPSPHFPQAMAPLMKLSDSWALIPSRS